MQKLINITHPDTQEVHRVTRSLFAELKEKGFTHTTKGKLKWFRNQVRQMVAQNSYKDYQKEMILKY